MKTVHSSGALGIISSDEQCQCEISYASFSIWSQLKEKKQAHFKRKELTGTAEKGKDVRLNHSLQ